MATTSQPFIPFTSFNFWLVGWPPLFDIPAHPLTFYGVVQYHSKPAFVEVLPMHVLVWNFSFNRHQTCELGGGPNHFDSSGGIPKDLEILTTEGNGSEILDTDISPDNFSYGIALRNFNPFKHINCKCPFAKKYRVYVTINWMCLSAGPFGFLSRQSTYGATLFPWLIHFHQWYLIPGKSWFWFQFKFKENRKEVLTDIRLVRMDIPWLQCWTIDTLKLYGQEIYFLMLHYGQ